MQTKRKFKNQKMYKKQVTIKAKAVSGAEGYQITYADNNKFKNAVNVNTSSVTKTIKKLKSKKTYYFKIRAYKTANAKRTYTQYSAVKKVKIK